MATQAAEKKRCATCGNRYSRCFEVVMDGRSYFFDCFECAIHDLAPTCATCGVMIVGHGLESEGIVYCCANCARAEGVTVLRDQASPGESTTAS